MIASILSLFLTVSGSSAVAPNEYWECNSSHRPEDYEQLAAGATSMFLGKVVWVKARPMPRGDGLAASGEGEFSLRPVRVLKGSAGRGMVTAHYQWVFIDDGSGWGHPPERDQIYLVRVEPGHLDAYDRECVVGLPDTEPK